VSPASQSTGTAEKTFLASRSPPVDAFRIPVSEMFIVPDSPSAELKVASSRAVSSVTVVVVWVTVADLRMTSYCRAVSVTASDVVPEPMARYPNLSSVKPAKTRRIMQASPTFVITFFRQYSRSMSFAGRLDGKGQFSPLHSSGVLTIFSGGAPYRYFTFPFLSLTMTSTQPVTEPMSMSLSLLGGFWDMSVITK